MNCAFLSMEWSEGCGDEEGRERGREGSARPRSSEKAMGANPTWRWLSSAVLPEENGGGGWRREENGDEKRGGGETVDKGEDAAAW